MKLYFPPWRDSCTLGYSISAAGCGNHPKARCENFPPDARGLPQASTPCAAPAKKRRCPRTKAPTPASAGPASRREQECVASAFCSPAANYPAPLLKQAGVAQLRPLDPQQAWRWRWAWAPRAQDPATPQGAPSGCTDRAASLEESLQRSGGIARR